MEYYKNMYFFGIESIIEIDHQMPNYGGHPQFLAKKPQYIIFRCH